MLTPQFLLPLADELIVDNFAGGGGASTGIERAIGRPVDIAVNHDPEAVAMHAANHPQTMHLCESVWDVNPREVCAGCAVEPPPRRSTALEASCPTPLAIPTDYELRQWYRTCRDEALGLGDGVTS